MKNDIDDAILFLRNNVKPFTRVKLSDKLTADTDGMLRNCFEHETLMSFYDDSDNRAFNDWWNQIGSKLFNYWYGENEDMYK